MCGDHIASFHLNIIHNLTSISTDERKTDKRSSDIRKKENEKFEVIERHDIEANKKKIQVMEMNE